VLLARGIEALPSPPAAHHANRGPGWLSTRAASGQNLIYVANGDEIVVFPDEKNAQPAGLITTGVTSAYGLFVDAQLNLYVCNQRENNVEVYPAGQTSPSFTYSTGLSRPLYAVADATRLFVGNASGGGVIVEYALGNAQPAYTLQSLGTEVDGITEDGTGNLYAAYRNGSAGGIEYFAQGTGSGEDLGISLTAPQGLVVDAKGNIYVAETQSAKRIEAFAPGQNQPFAQTGRLVTPTGLQLDAAEKNLYDSNLRGIVEHIAYPGLKGGGRWEVTPGPDGVQGLALSPPAPL